MSPVEAQLCPQPMLLHFDVNKTVMLTDSMDAKSHEEGIREAVSDLFWGILRKTPDGWEWAWLGNDTIGSKPPRLPELSAQAGETMEYATYADYCKKIVKDKKDRKSVLRNFTKATPETKEAMERMVKLAAANMELPGDVRNNDKLGLEQVGLKGNMYMMLPAIFILVADLVRRRQPFAVVFRSFGKDHEKIKAEWNAFCEMKHPVFSKLLSGIGPLDGTVPGIPDRRLSSFHTLYRDADGPVLALDTFTNGPEENSWDSWAKAKPRSEADTRNGRAFLREVLRCQVLEGLDNLEQFFEKLLGKQGTIAIKDDWAWWTWNGESNESGKLMPMMGKKKVNAIFFDDNIEQYEPRIVDCRDEFGNPCPKEKTLGITISKVNPVEAALDDRYFLRAVESCLQASRRNSKNFLVGFDDTDIEGGKAGTSTRASEPFTSMKAANWDIFPSLLWCCRGT
mmetsp:Transcript_9816/g.17764  ORF Transcript_9816/g.17764 Transcript_9816/m.17764 type:complete len:453 (+) Transcript_9816:65-1423(+)